MVLFLLLLEKIQFLYRSHVQVFLYVISLVCHLKYPSSCFSPHFCYLDFVGFLLVLIVTGYRN